MKSVKYLAYIVRYIYVCTYTYVCLRGIKIDLEINEC
jgi:hypothetical protein